MTAFLDFGLFLFLPLCHCTPDVVKTKRRCQAWTDLSVSPATDSRTALALALASRESCPTGEAIDVKDR